MMKRLLLAIGFSLLALPAWAACAVTNLQVKDNAAVTANVPYADDGSGGSNCSPQIQIKQGGNVVAVAGSAADGVSNTTPGLWAYQFPFWFNGTTWDRARGDATNGAFVNIKSSVALTANQGTANATPWNVSVTNTNANGQTAMAGSSPVVLPNNMAAIALWGQGATAATTPTSATAGGCNGVNAFPTAVTNGQMAVPNCDLDATSITRPWAPKARWVSGVTSAMTGTTSTQLIAAVTSNKLYLTTITCGNSHATVGTFVNVQDGSGGATLWTIPAGAVYGGAVNNIVPPVATTSGNGVFVVDATTGANVICSGSGYSGP